jgi:hypothetical protein
MFSSLPDRWIIPWVAVCVLLLFLFPVAQGSFQATHGPSTAFRGRKALLALILSIIQSGMIVFSKVPALANALMNRIGLLAIGEYADCVAIDSLILRC